METSGSVAGMERADRAYALAYEYEQKHGCCPQCVIAALQNVFGVVDDQTFKALQVFGGGGGLSTLGTCGTLVGAMAAVSAECGREKADFAKGRKLEAYTYGKEILDEFVAEFGAVLCRDVQTKMMGRSFDMWDAEDFKAFEAAGGHQDKCPAVVGTATRIAAKKLIEIEGKSTK
jgi:C_GCAxxG_C_C family probable redox protein